MNRTDPSSNAPARSLIDTVLRGEQTVALSFAGQGVGWIEPLAELDQQHAAVRELVDACDAALSKLVQTQRFSWSGHAPQGFELARWVRDPSSRPGADILSSSVVSQPAILLAQAARWLWLLGEGFGEAVEKGRVVAGSGHSQGVMAALLVAQRRDGRIDPQTMARFAEVMAWQGLAMSQSAGSRARRVGEATPMAAVSGPTAAQVQAVMNGIFSGLHGADQPVISLWNTRTRNVVSAAPALLLQLHAALQTEGERQAKQRKDGQLGGAPLKFTWEWLDVSGPFHGPAMQAGLAEMQPILDQMGFSLADPAFAVLSPSTALPYAAGQALAEVMRDEFVRPVRWPQTVRALAERADVILDLGPGDGVAKLTMSNLRGSGVRTLPLDVAEGRRQLLDGAGPGPRPQDWRAFKPKLCELPDGQVLVDNRFSRACAMPPVILPGMTPTTADAPIVAAAANAGYWAELAGGGQPTAEILRLRIEELAETLQPGRGVILNALYLDPWLWDLQVKKGLVAKARQKGLPVIGMTVSAGIPPVDEAVKCVRDWLAAGMRHIAFKPGTAPQIDQVCKIAQALPQVTLHVQVEGGKAGGHHSWEDLEELLIDGYAKIRACPNLVLSVGGGIATEARAVELLTGTWSRRHQLSDMPVDAVFLGTLAMACREATATASVKQALVQAKGTGSWVFAGKAQGGVTSGKSQLNADIHYIDNHAARVGRLLDSVAGDAAAVAARKGEIVAALAGTAKPYFGDFGQMHWQAVLERTVELLATGNHGRYEDGAWLDPTWRQRALDLFARAEARMAGQAGAQPRQKWQTGADLDDPAAALADMRRHYPQAAEELPHPADEAFFVQLCARAGKPVPFVPVIDGDVRRWYKSDALWQAQDPRFAADQVLIIPGPEAVAGIAQADEPVADLLRRFERAVVEALREQGERPAAQARLAGGGGDSQLARLAQRGGPVAALCADVSWVQGGRFATPWLHRLCGDDGSVATELAADGAIQQLTWQGHGETVRAVQTGESTARVEIELGLSPGRPVLAFDAVHVRHTGGGEHVQVDDVAWKAAVQALYQQLVADAAAEPVKLFEPAREDAAAISQAQATAWAALADGIGGAVALDLAFPLAWRAIFRVMACGELAGGWLELLHARHAVTAHNGRLQADQPATVVARAVRVEDSDAGRAVQIATRISQGAVQLELETELLVRGRHAPLQTAWARVPAGAQVVALAQRELRQDGPALDAGAAAFVAQQAWLHWRGGAPQAGQLLHIEADLLQIQLRDGRAWHGGKGQMAAGEARADVNLPGDFERRREHPVAALAALLNTAPPIVDTPERTLAALSCTAPARSLPFAEVGGDFNPLHHSPAAARLAGLPEPIVHGMWTASRLSQFVARAAGVPEGNLHATDARFLAPVPHGAPLQLRAARIGMVGGRQVVEATATVGPAGQETLAARSRYELAPPKTAYVFPGQGIQQQNMGMAGYARSRAARAVWDRADAFTRQALGFSVLEVVRKNPQLLHTPTERHVHPQGVLHLTQFTQVAMSVLAMAQVAEMREAGVLDESAATCGHSVGEYNALSAYTEVLPLETVVDIVWLRGCTMHTVVPRDAAGKSAYAMGVVRPNLAKLDHAGAEALVAQVAEQTGHFIQIVNHNVRDRQYSVTGELPALQALQNELVRRQPAGGKPAWIVVPGIDVPFHSSVLHGAVPAFREILDRRLPHDLDPARLVGRYVPNLVAQPFALDRAFVQLVHGATQSPQLASALHGAPMCDPQLARLLLVELLAWQFASPVRWIESQEVLLAPADRGGMGVQRLIEVGVAHAPTLANMARTTLQVMGIADDAVQIRNLEADLDLVLQRDADPVAETAAPEPVAAPVAVAAAAPAATVTAPTAASGPTPSKPMTVSDALRALVALQARLRPEQLGANESLDEVFEGVSSRRNQALVDIGAEFGVGQMDGAAEKPLATVAAEIAKRSPGYKAPGKYLRGAVEDAAVKLLGRAGLAKRDAAAHLQATFGLDEATADHVLVAMALQGRPGESVRGGALGSLQAAGSAAAGKALVEAAAHAWATAQGVGLASAAATGATGGGVVDSAALQALEGKLFGKDGVLTHMAEAISAAGSSAAPTAAAPGVDPAAAVLAAELGPKFAELSAPAFDPAKHAQFGSAWAYAHQQLVELWLDLANQRRQPADCRADADRLAAFGADARIADSARYFADRARALNLPEAAQLLRSVATPKPMPPLQLPGTRPHTAIGTDGQLRATEKPDASRTPPPVALPLQGKVALVTGASPGSIALEVVRHLLRGGCQVVCTTSSFEAERLGFYRQFFAANCGPGAELHVVPFNQASAQDQRNLLDWCFGAGGLAPDLCLPFAALKDLGHLGDLSERADAVLRAMLGNVLRMVAGLGARTMQRSDLPHRRCHVVLPLSPNHGQFGGDGFYAETKIGLETLFRRWSSEAAAWGNGVSLCGVRIGWVRGTGLMDAHDAVAAGLEDKSGIQTYSAAQMGALIAELCGAEARQKAAEQPVDADLTGGFGALANVGEVVAGVRGQVEALVATARKAAGLQQKFAELTGREAASAAPASLPAWPLPVAQTARADAMPKPRLKPEQMVVCVGIGELGPCGSARTRFAIETGETPDTAAVIELAWQCGLVRWQNGAWTDSNGAAVADDQWMGHYWPQVRQRIGIRPVDPQTAGFDPRKLDSLAVVFAERDLAFDVPTEADAQAFMAIDPQRTRIAQSDAGAWRVTRLKGAELRVPKALALTRHVAGLLPDGLDYSRFGIPRDMLGSTDPVALMNLIATADAFASAGLQPEELLGAVHPARVANTQGSGIGGMHSLHRLYLDPALGDERQNDALQETLINVMGAYAVQAYVGSYGAMAHPVAACATAAVSIETAVDKLLLKRADFAVAGGADDYGSEGAVGFSDMGATADSVQMGAAGILPRQMSRPNDLRRKGFVEAQGGGTMLLTRGDVALRMGLPVYAVVGYAASHGDGVHRSIPAPGQGVLAVAMGGMESPLGQALRDHGLTADDIAIVSKHDTSTGANDPNESRLHHRIAAALGRTPGNPLLVVSQKSLTGHSKGGAAAWQFNGLCQMLASGKVPANRNLDCVDPALREHQHLCWTNRPLDAGKLPLRAGLLTSLGFGHVGALCLVIHPDCFAQALTDEQRAQWQAAATIRRQQGQRRTARALMGEQPIYERRTHRRFDAHDGTAAQMDEEAALLTDPAARLNPSGRYGKARG